MSTGYQVAYRIGGHMSFIWHLSEVLETEEKAQKRRDRHCKEGFFATYDEASFFERFGKPDSFFYCVWQEKLDMRLRETEAVERKSKILKVLNLAGIDLTNVSIEVAA